MNLAPLKFRAREIREEGPSLPDWFIRRVCGDPPQGPKAIREARYAAQLLEEGSRGEPWTRVTR
jgi:hypothetical protein